MVHIAKDLNQIFPKVLLRNPILFRDILINSVLPTVACPELRREFLNIIEAIVDGNAKINNIDPGNREFGAATRDGASLASRPDLEIVKWVQDSAVAAGADKEANTANVTIRNDARQIVYDLVSTFCFPLVVVPTHMGSSRRAKQPAGAYRNLL